jgi:pyrroloquinoline quinone biosynthesis protein B
VKPRSQSGLALTGDGAVFTLLNASPDLGQQIRATPELWPAEPRGSPIGAVVLTGAEIDHIAGLLVLRERHAFRLIALEPVLAVLAANPVFDALAADRVERIAARPREPFEPSPGVRLRLDPAPGKAALFLERGDPTIAEGGEAAAVFAEIGASRLAYVPACAAMTPSLASRLGEADVILFDGTLFDDEEMIRLGVGAKTGQRMGHLPISGPGGSLAILRAMPARKIYTHINNTNAILVQGSAERRAVEEAGIEVAEDGMVIEL